MDGHCQAAVAQAKHRCNSWWMATVKLPLIRATTAATSSGWPLSSCRSYQGDNSSNSQWMTTVKLSLLSGLQQLRLPEDGHCQAADERMRVYTYYIFSKMFEKIRTFQLNQFNQTLFFTYKALSLHFARPKWTLLPTLL